MGAFDYEHTAMKTVVVDKESLALCLATNLEKHKKEYVEARMGYEDAQRQALAKLSKRAAFAATSGSAEGRNSVKEAWDKYRKLDVPQNHTDVYEQAIMLMEWEKRDEVELSINDFECYVRDNFEWSRNFRSMHKAYSH